eukprot:gene21812-477_t
MAQKIIPFTEGDRVTFVKDHARTIANERHNENQQNWYDDLKKYHPVLDKSSDTWYAKVVFVVTEVKEDSLHVKREDNFELAEDCGVLAGEQDADAPPEAYPGPNVNANGIRLVLLKWAAKNKDGQDQRSRNDLLIDYLLAKAYPSQSHLDREWKKNTEHMHVYNDGNESSWTMYDPRTLTDNVIVEGSNGGGAAEDQHPMLMSAPNEIDGSNKKGGKRWKTLGCTPSLHHNSLLQDFFELGGYRCFPDAVMCEVMFRELLAVDAVNCTYTVDFILTTRWYDRTFDTPQYQGRSNIEVFAKTIPHLTIKDVDFSFEGKNIPDVGRIGDEHHQGFVHLRRAKDPPGVLYRSQRIQVKLRDVNTLEMFPFDKQILELCLRLPGSDDPSSIDYGKVILPLNVVMQLANDPIDWQVYPATASSRRSRGDRQMFVATLHVKRKPRYYEINIFLALFLISTLIFGV